MTNTRPSAGAAFSEGDTVISNFSAAVGAKRYRDSSRAHFDHGCQPRAELEVRAGAVQHPHTAFSHQRLLGVIDPDAMCQAEAMGGQSGIGEIVDVLLAGAGLDERDLIAILRRMGVDDELMLLRQTGDGPSSSASKTPRTRAKAARKRPLRGRATLGDCDASSSDCGLFQQPRRNASYGGPSCNCRPRRAAHRFERLESGSVSCTVSCQHVVFPKQELDAAGGQRCQDKPAYVRPHRPHTVFSPRSARSSA